MDEFKEAAARKRAGTTGIRELNRLRVASRVLPLCTTKKEGSACPYKPPLATLLLDKGVDYVQSLAKELGDCIHNTAEDYETFTTEMKDTLRDASRKLLPICDVNKTLETTRVVDFIRARALQEAKNFQANTIASLRYTQALLLRYKKIQGMLWRVRLLTAHSCFKTWKEQMLESQKFASSLLGGDIVAKLLRSRRCMLMWQNFMGWWELTDDSRGHRKQRIALLTEINNLKTDHKKEVEGLNWKAKVAQRTFDIQYALQDDEYTEKAENLKKVISDMQSRSTELAELWAEARYREYHDSIVRECFQALLTNWLNSRRDEKIAMKSEIATLKDKLKEEDGGVRASLDAVTAKYDELAQQLLDTRVGRFMRTRLLAALGAWKQVMLHKAVNRIQTRAYRRTLDWGLMRRSFNSWLEKKCTGSTNEYKVLRFLSRWMNMAVSGAFDSWRQVTSVKADSQLMLNKARVKIQRVLLRFTFDQFQLGLGTLQEANNHKKKARRVWMRLHTHCYFAAWLRFTQMEMEESYIAIVMFKKLDQRRLLRVFWYWADVMQDLVAERLEREIAANAERTEDEIFTIEQARLMKKATQWFRKSIMVTAWNSWQDYIANLSRLQTVTKFINKIMHKNLQSRAFESWLCATELHVQVRDMASRVVNTLANCALQFGLDAFVSYREWMIEKREKLDEIMERMLNACLRTAFMSWQHLTYKHMRKLMYAAPKLEKVAIRWRDIELRNVLEAWFEVLEAKKSRHHMARVMAQERLLKCRKRCFYEWHDSLKEKQADEAIRETHKLTRALHMMQRASWRVERQALVAWYELLQRGRRLNHLRKYWGRHTSVTRKTVVAWRDAVKRKLAQKQILMFKEALGRRRSTLNFQKRVFKEWAAQVMSGRVEKAAHELWSSRILMDLPVLKMMHNGLRQVAAMLTTFDKRPIQKALGDIAAWTQKLNVAALRFESKGFDEQGRICCTQHMNMWRQKCSSCYNNCTTTCKCT
ncbi:hypothetical protein CYMTET_49981 [Cymbomonas tetramitiformis]|uniref:Sfi1 spindle body domain-containing protein n=1 Tax=Cymbomonas tetramitiformis TaxID=36881 RepID=A0AAE0ETL3_9CHLO|nr:hypothetical protein CYMTET_49981 [Cymbomonas tetramitiformis]